MIIFTVNLSLEYILDIFIAEPKMIKNILYSFIHTGNV